MKMDKREKLLNDAIDAIRKMFSNTDASKEQTKHDLEILFEEICTLLDALNTGD